MGDPYYRDWAADYDANSRGVPGDIEFYSELAGSARGLVVELGVGTGRIAIPCSQAGARIYGVELEPAMLAVARERVVAAGVEERVTLRQGDMRDVGTWGLPGPAALVTIPFRTFLHNLTVEDQVATLRSCHQALEQGGRLALNVFNPSITKIAQWGQPSYRRRWEPWGADPERGVQVQHDYEASAQVVTSRLRVRDASGRWRRTFVTLRYVYRFEMEHLLARCGFEVDAVYGGFDRCAPSEVSTELVWVARKA